MSGDAFRGRFKIAGRVPETAFIELRIGRSYHGNNRRPLITIAVVVVTAVDDKIKRITRFDFNLADRCARILSLGFPRTANT